MKTLVICQRLIIQTDLDLLIKPALNYLNVISPFKCQACIIL